MKSVIVNKDVFTDFWMVEHITQIPIEVIDLGDTKEVFYEELVIDEDMTFKIQTHNGEETVIVKAGVYEPPFYLDEYEKIVL